MDVSDVLAANTTAPSSGQRDTGWTPSQVAVSSYTNRIWAFIYLWLKWLDSITTSDGRLIQQTRTLVLGPSNFVAVSASPSPGVASLLGAALNAFANVPLPIGKRITAVRVFIIDNTSGPTKQRAQFQMTTIGGIVGSPVTSSVSAGTGAAQTLTISGLTSTVTANEAPCIQVQCTTGSANVQITGAEVDYDELV